METPLDVVAARSADYIGDVESSTTWDVIMQLRGRSVEELRQTATALADEGRHLAAGYMLDHAAHESFGNPDVMHACAIGAWNSYRHIIETERGSPLPRATAILLASQLVQAHYLFPADYAPLPHTKQLQEELAQHLTDCFKHSTERDIYLVRGVIVETDLVERFEGSPISREARWGRSSWTPAFLRIEMPSAFTLLRSLGDYELAHELVELCPNAFTTPGLRGWRAAVRGLFNPSSGPESFSEAADAFAEDSQPESIDQLTDGWDNMNVGTWAPYFRVRSLLALAVREPLRVRELVALAAEAADPDAGGRSAPNVRRLALLVRALRDLLSSDAAIDFPRFREDFQAAVRGNGEKNDGDDMAVRAIATAAEAFEGFKKCPEVEITRGRLRDAIDALRRIPFLDAGLSEAIEPALGAQAFNLRDRPILTWAHRALARVTDERQLHHIILRLSQASLPLYAQVLHGPLEYGKDVIVYLERDGRRVLRMYQAKVGDISLPDWRATYPQLEEMFLVPIPDFLVGSDPDTQREGILFCNGHAKPTAVPVMDGWFAEQRRVHRRNFQFMHLDDIVRWISADSLVNEFRAALRDLDIPTDGS